MVRFSISPSRLTTLATIALAALGASAQDSIKKSAIKRCEILPLPDHQVSLQIDGNEKLRWNFGSQYPRPFFYPFNGPSGTSLTRMGHPGAPNHDHHQSIWFAYSKVNGFDFWANGKKTQIRQKDWLAYEDGDREAIMAVSLGWYDPNDNEVLSQETVAALIPMENDEHALEIQFTLRPPEADQKVQLEQTNFGFLAVRVAKSLSTHFGGGEITNSEGQVGEPQIFAKPARWVDYSGAVSAGTGKTRSIVSEGITCFDHPDNPRYPTHWHVRHDGWMGAAFGLKEGHWISSQQPLTLRYLLHAHAGAYDPAKAVSIADEFAKRPGLQVSKSSQPHRQYEVRRANIAFEKLR